MHIPLFENKDTLSFAFMVCIILYIDGKQFRCVVFTFVQYIWTPNTFLQLVNCKSKLSYSIANLLLSFIRLLFCLLDIKISFVLSIFIIIPFSRQHILSKFKECCILFSNVSLSKPLSYNVVSSAYKYTDRIETPINRGKSFINIKTNRGPKMEPCGTPYSTLPVFNWFVLMFTCWVPVT